MKGPFRGISLITFTLLTAILLVMALTPLSALASGVPAPAAAPTRPVEYTLAIPLLLDAAGGRLYATVHANGQASHIGVYSARDGRPLTTFPYRGPFALDAEGSRLFVISERDQITVLNSRTGIPLRTLQVHNRSPSALLAPAPQYDVQTGQLLVFDGNVMMVVDPNTGKEVSSARFDVPVQDGCRIRSSDPLPIGQSLFDAERRLLYLEFTTYSCTPYVGHTIVAYDLDRQAEVSRRGSEPYKALAAGGGLYVESWYRLGIGTIWTERNGKPHYSSTGWSGGTGFQLDARRYRLYQGTEGSIRIFEPATMKLIAVVPQPAKGVLAAYDAVTDQLYFVDGTSVRPWPATKLRSATALIAQVKNLPREVVRLVVPSPAWQQDKTLFAAWYPPPGDTRCYVFNQTYYSGPLLLSRDGGKQWLQPIDGLPADCGLASALAVSPAYARDSTLFAGIRGNGIFKSNDGGASWQPSGHGLPYLGVNGIALSPGFAADRTVFASVLDNGLQRSVDGGETWQTLGTGVSPLIALSPEFDRDTTLVAYGMKAGGGVIQLSEDRGSTWRDLTLPSDAAVRMLSLAPAFNRWGVMFAGDLNGDLYRSADRGRSWQRVLEAGGAGNPGTGADQVQIAYGPNEARREIFLVISGTRLEGEKRVTWGRLYRSADGGQTWTEMSLDKRAIPTALAISPSYAQDGLLFVGTADGNVLSVHP